MSCFRSAFNLAAGIGMVVIGSWMWFQGTFHKTGDIADIYTRYLGVFLLGFGALSLVSYGLTMYLASRKRNRE
jgi:hypothetical protein